MKLIISKSLWEIYDDPLEQCIERIVNAGYDAIEINIFNRPELPEQVRRLLRATGLPVIVQIGSGAGMLDDHLRNLETRYEHGLCCDPLFFNCHTGSDHLCFDDNLRVFDRAEQLSARHGVPICHETHRGRALFNLPVAVRFLQAMPQLRLTADFSHWFCVHESDLSDQESSLNQILPSVHHVHARVGFNEGPQVSDPRNPLHAVWVNRFVELWHCIADHAQQQNRFQITFTPEFGPIGYVPLRGIEPVPVADPWEINLWMRNRLREWLAPYAHEQNKS